MHNCLNIQYNSWSGGNYEPNNCRWASADINCYISGVERMRKPRDYGEDKCSYCGMARTQCCWFGFTSFKQSGNPVIQCSRFACRLRSGHFWRFSLRNHLHHKLQLVCIWQVRNRDSARRIPKPLFFLISKMEFKLRA